MTSKDRSALRTRGPRLRASHGIGMAIVLTMLVGLAACRKSETSKGGQPAGGGPTTTGGETAASTPSVAEAPGPSIQQTADTSKPPYSGLRSPRGASVDDKGRLWIIDTGNCAVKIFDPAGGYLGGWGGRGSGKYALRDPFGIAVRGDDVYVADTFGAGIEQFTQAGEFKAKAEAGLYGPHCVATAPDGKVWIGDTGNNRVLVCERNLTSPRGIGKKGAGPEDFSGPIGIAVGPSGRVYVADVLNRRIQVLDSDGTFKAHWAFKGFGPNTEPYIEVDQDESLYVSDQGAPPSVVHLDRSGNEIHRWTSDDSGQKLIRPTGLAVDRKNRVLYVVNGDTVSKIKLSGK